MPTTLPGYPPAEAMDCRHTLPCSVFLQDSLGKKLKKQGGSRGKKKAMTGGVELKPIKKKQKTWVGWELPGTG